MLVEIKNRDNWDDLFIPMEEKFEFQDGEFYYQIYIPNTEFLINISINSDELQSMIDRWFSYTR